MAGLRGAVRALLARKVYRDTAGSLATGIASQLVLVASGILVARVLGPTDRGHLALLVLIPTILVKVGGLGLPLSLTYAVARAPELAGRVFARVARFAVLQSVVLLVAHGAVLVVLLRDKPASVVTAGLLTLALSPVMLAHEYALAALQGIGRFAPFNILRMLPAAVYSAGVVSLFLAGDAQLVAIAAAWIAANVGVAAASATIAWRSVRNTRAAGDAPALKTMLGFGLKSFLGAASPIETFRLDQTVVGLFLAPAALGYYVAAVAFTNLPRLLAQSIGMVSYPYVARRSDRDGRRATWRFFWLTAAVSVLVVGALELTIGWLLPFLFGEDFAQAVPMSRILIAGSLFVGLRRVLTDCTRGLGRPMLGTVAELSLWFVIAPGVPLGVHFGGALGVAYAVLAASVVSLLVIVVGILAFAREDGRRISAVPRSVLAVAAVAVLDAIGLAALLVADAAVELLLVLAAVFGYVVIKHAHARQRRLAAAEDPGAEVVEGAGGGRDGLGIPRAIYYVGMLLVGVLVVRPGGALTLSDGLFFLSLAALAGVLIGQRRTISAGLPTPLAVGLALFTVGGLLSAFATTASATDSVAVIVRVVYLVAVWFWLGTVLLTEERHIRTAMLLWVVSAGASGVVAILQTALGPIIPDAMYGYGRVSGLTEHFNDLGGLAGCTVVPALALVSRTSGSSGVQRVIAGACLPLIIIGLVLSGSVSGIIAALVAWVIWAAATRSFVRGLVTVALAVFVTSLVVGTATDRTFRSPLQRASTATSQSGTENSTLWTRVDAYSAAWREIRGNPLVGVGLTPGDTPTATGSQVHNALIKPLYEAGFFGFVGMLLIYVATGVAGWRAAVRARGESERHLALALLISYVAFVTWAMTQPALFKRYGWVTGALIFALTAQQAARRARPAQGPATAGTVVRSP